MVQLAVEQEVTAVGVSGIGGALSVGSQESVEDPGAVACVVFNLHAHTASRQDNQCCVAEDVSAVL